MTVRNVTKSLAVMEDLATGVGSVLQKRGTGRLIDVPFTVNSIAELDDIDTSKYTLARVCFESSFKDYIFVNNAWTPRKHLEEVLEVIQTPTDNLIKVETFAGGVGVVYEVRKTSDNSLATIYSDKDGTTEIVQNGTDNKSGSDGVVKFYIENTFAELKIQIGTNSAKFRNNALYNLISSQTPISFSHVDLLKSGTIAGNDLSSSLKSLIDGFDVPASTQSYRAGWAATAKPVGNAKYILTTRQRVRDSLSDPAWVPDGFGDHYLFGGTEYVATLNEDIPNAQQYGAGSGQPDDAPAIEAAIIANNALDFTDGTYLIATSIKLKGNLTLRFSTGAILRPRTNNFSLFKYTDSGVISNLVINNPFITDFGGIQTNVTGFELKNLGTGCEIHSPKGTKIERLINVTGNSYGLKIYSPSTFLVPKPIETATTVGTVDVYSPNLDNGLPIGGSGIGTGIKFGGSGITHGGYVQGFVNGIEWNGRGANYGTYTESCSDAGNYFNGAFGVTVVGAFWFGFEGTSGFKGRNSEAIKIINPISAPNNATLGLFDFDSSNRGCTYEITRKQDGTLNRKLGDTTGIQPSSSQNDAYKALTTKKNLNNEGVAVDFFRIAVQDNSSTRVEVQLEAIETNSYFGAISRKAIFLIRRSAAATTISDVLDVVDFGLDNTNANFILDAVITTSLIDPNTIGVYVQINSDGAVTPATIDVRARVEAETTGVLVDTWAV